MIRINIGYGEETGIAFIDPHKVSCVHVTKGFECWYVYFNSGTSFFTYNRSNTKEEATYYLNEFVKILDKAKTKE